MWKTIQRASEDFTRVLQTRHRSKELHSRHRVPSAAVRASDRISRTVKYSASGGLGTVPSRRDTIWCVIPRCRSAALRLSRWCVVFTLCCGFVMSSVSSAWCQPYRSYKARSISPGWRSQGRLVSQDLELASRKNAGWILLSKEDERKRSSRKKKSDRKNSRKYQRSPKDNRDKSKNKYKQWESLSPGERQELRRRMKRWKELSPEERQLLRRRHEQWQELSPEERRSIQRKLEKWDKLSPAEQEEIRQRFRR